MIRYLKRPFDTKIIDSILTSEIREWFYSNFKDYTLPQKYSIMNIHNKQNTLICSPTGSGKTLSAFTSILNELIKFDIEGKLEDRVYAIYISPLKALGNDIERNLNTPLNDIKEIYEKKNIKLNLRVAKRTGDTSSAKKSKMSKKPPHVLITTPETFDIILTSKKFRSHLVDVKWLIVDEIHSIAESKRGSDLSVSMERLNLLSPFYTRIGISATISPLDEVARFLVGFEYNNNDTLIERNCDIVDLSLNKKKDIKVRTPVDNLSKYRIDYIQNKLYDLLHKEILKHNTTLIFTNTRARTEKLVNELKYKYNKFYDIYSSDQNSNFNGFVNKRSIKSSFVNNKTKKYLIGAHHGSLSKQTRLQIEDKLKRGEMKCVVSSTSLELGIDIGSIDLVILLGSPKSVSRLIQRMGRSGHSIFKKSKALMIASTRDELIECSLLSKCLLEKKVDKIRIPKSALDVLSQQIIGISCDEFRKEEELFDLFRRSYAFKDLSYKDFHETVEFLSGANKSFEKKYIFSKLRIDENGYVVARSQMTRILYLSNLGTIPDQANIKVKQGDEYIGSLDESFSERLKKGDVFVLGGNNYEYVVKRNTTIKVRQANHKLPTVPSWYSEMLPLSFEIGMEILNFNKKINSKLKEYYKKYNKNNNIVLENNNEDNKVIQEFICKELSVDNYTILNLLSYYKEQFLYSQIPTLNNLLIEEYQEDKHSKVHYIFYTYYGRRVNDAFSRIVAYYIGKYLKKDIEVAVNDFNFYVAIDERIDIISYLKRIINSNLDDILDEALDKTDLLKRRFRDCATRSFLILKRYKNVEKSVAKQEISSTILLKLVREFDHDFFVIRESKREIKYDLMDLENLKIIFKEINRGNIKLNIEHTQIPSPFSLNILTQGYSDVLKIKDREEFLLNMRALILNKLSTNSKIDYDIKREIDYINYKIKSMSEYNKEIEDIDDVEIKKIKYKELLIRQLKTGVYKDEIPEAVFFDVQNSIMQDDYVLSYETKIFFKEKFSGPIKDYWKDEIVKYIYNKIDFVNKWYED